MIQKLTATLVSALALAVLLVPAATAAEQPNQTQYGNAASTLPTETPPPSSPAHLVAAKGASESSKPATTGDTLPFTGLDLGIVIAFGIAAVGGGMLLRRAARPTEG